MRDLAKMSRTGSEVFPLDPQIAQRVVLLAGSSQRERAPRQRTTRDERFRLRQSIFDMGRACAAELLAELGARETSVGMAADRSPVWPHGYVGSVTHTDDLLGVAVARRTDFRSIGIDAEAIIQPGTTVEIDDLCMSEREEHTSELQSLAYLVCRLLLEKKKKKTNIRKENYILSSAETKNTS